VKAAWQTLPLGELCEILDSERKPVTKRDRKPGPYPYYGATGVQDYVDGYLFDEPLVLVGEDGAKWGPGESSAYAVEGKVWVNNHAHVLRPSRGKLIDSWLIYYLNDTDLTRFVTGLTVPKLNQGNLRDIPVPLPPLPEQRRIVALLDEAFEGIAKARANAERNGASAQQILEGYAHEVFSSPKPEWKRRDFEGCIEDVTYTTKVQRKAFLDEGRHPIVSQEADFINGYWNDSKDLFRVTRPLVVFGDHTRVFKYIDFDFVLGADGVKVLAPRPDLNPKFFYHQLRSLRLKSLGYARHYRILKEQTLLVPPLSEQAVLVEAMDALDADTAKLEDVCNRKLAALDELKKSLLHHAFAGEL
jgi:type I restriction enzyme S subunit